MKRRAKEPEVARNVDEPVATRSFRLELPDGAGLDVALLVDKPQPTNREDGQVQEWRCAYRITGVGSEKESCAFGVDSLQALLLALTGAEANLRSLARAEGGQLRWLGELDLGLPSGPLS